MLVSRYFTFEVTVGMNGAVWFRSAGIRVVGSTGGAGGAGGEGLVETVAIRNALLNSALLDDAHAEAMVDRLAALTRRLREASAVSGATSNSGNTHKKSSSSGGGSA